MVRKGKEKERGGNVKGEIMSRRRESEKVRFI